MNNTVIALQHQKCEHNKFVLDDSLSYIKCGICGEHLNPLWVLKQLSNHEARYNRRIIELKKIAEKADNKNKCKCQHCGKMTAIQK